MDANKIEKTTDGHRFTAAAGHFKSNAFGLYDMHGNVWEWCGDCYDMKGYAADAQVNPTAPKEGAARVHGGGGWSDALHRLRSAAHVGRDRSSYRNAFLGFRIALEPR